MDDIAYRGGAQIRLETEKPQTSDERDLPTLVQVRDILKAYVDELPSNFNAFDASKTTEQLHIDIKALQQTHAMIEPLYNAVNGVVDKIYKQKRGE